MTSCLGLDQEFCLLALGALLEIAEAKQKPGVPFQKLRENKQITPRRPRTIIS